MTPSCIALPRRPRAALFFGSTRRPPLAALAVLSLAGCLAEVPGPDEAVDVSAENALALVLSEASLPPGDRTTDPAGDSACQVASDPDCGPQPHSACGHTYGHCPTGMHSTFRGCFINCGDYDLRRSGPDRCSPDHGANSLVCENDTNEFFTCDQSCPRNYRTQRTVTDVRCQERVSRLCKYVPPDPPPTKFVLQHIGGQCIHPKGGASTPAHRTPALLHPLCTQEPRLQFIFRENGSLQQVSSGFCLQAEGGSERPAIGTRVVYTRECGTRLGDLNGNKKMKFELTPEGSLRHVHSGLCVHPSGGSATPGFETELVLWDICNEPRLRFTAL
jgi:hypothetical protein